MCVRAVSFILCVCGRMQGAQEMMKIYLRNDSFKTFMVASSDTARDVCAKMAQKLGIEDLAGNLDLISMTKEEGACVLMLA